MRDFFFYDANRVFFYFQVSFCHVKRGNRAGSSRNESDYSWRGTQTPVSRLSQLREFRTSSCFNFLARKTKGYQTDQLSVFSLHSWKMSWSEFLTTATLEKRRLDFLALRGKTCNLKAKKRKVCNQKKKPRIKNGLIPKSLSSMF